MYTFISFDIKYKTNQVKIENILRHFGLRKIQNNTYIGKLNNLEINDIKDNISNNINNKDTLIIFPICDMCYSKKESFGGEIKFREDLYRVF